MSLSSELVLLFWAGFVYAAPIGAVGVMAFLQMLSHHLSSAARLALGVLFVDAIFLTIFVLLIELIGDVPERWFQQVWWIWLIGGCALVIYGVVLLAQKTLMANLYVEVREGPFLFAVKWSAFKNPAGIIGAAVIAGTLNAAGVGQLGLGGKFLGVVLLIAGGGLAWVTWLGLASASRWVAGSRATNEALVHWVTGLVIVAAGLSCMAVGWHLPNP